MKKEKFIEKARKVHGDKFDYSLVPDIVPWGRRCNHAKIKIICPIHGVFEQESYEHIVRPYSCPRCSGNVKLTQTEYVNKAILAHGDIYDYSESVYIAGLKPITIRCKKHDYKFTLMAGNHIRKVKPQGCPLCASERKQAQYEKYRLEHPKVEKPKRNKELFAKEREERKQKRFREKVHEMYGDKYDLTNIIYKDNDTPFTLVCPEHGTFSTSYKTLIKGFNHSGRITPPHDCPECCGIKSPSHLKAEDFWKEIKRLYGDKYDFSRSLYTKQNDSIFFVCPKHGEQKVRAASLLKGAGCPRCSGVVQTLEDYIERAKQVHGDRYDYSKTTLTRKNGNVILTNILCREHGYFDTRSNVHIQQGCECPRCTGHFNDLTPEQRKEHLIKKAQSRFGDRFDYSEVVYTNKHDKVWIRCKEHDYRFLTDLSEHCRRAGGCPFCSNSSGEADIRKWLEDNHVEYIPQYQIPNDNPECIRQYFLVDFFLPVRNCFIEFNGGQHYKDIPYFRVGGWTLEQQQLRDQLVRKYAEEHGIKMIEIPYTEQGKIPEILSKQLNI